MKAAVFGALLAVVAIVLLWLMRRPNAVEKTPQDYQIDTLVADQQRYRDSVEDALEKTARERDSVLRLSDARGDTMRTLRRQSDILGDSLDKIIGQTPTYTFDSAACNVALRLALRQRAIITNERDICATDRDQLRHQLVRDSAEHRQSIASLLFRIDTLTGAVTHERTKPRPCRVNLLIAKPKCGPTLVVTNALSLIFGFSLGN